MIANHRSERTGQLRLKKPADWFAAGEGFLKAMEILSDGAFKLFVFVCLKADRHSATYRTSSEHLARALRKPLDAIESSLAEMMVKKACSMVSKNPLSLRIEDEFWPYDISPCHASTSQCATDYVATVRQLFLNLGCTSGRFGASDEVQAKSLEKRGVPLDIVRDAMIMAACRKYISWLNNGYSEPIASVAYFESIIDEFLRCPPPADYCENLPSELKRLSKQWSYSAQLPNQISETQAALCHKSLDARAQNPLIQGVPDYGPQADRQSWASSERHFPDRISEMIKNDNISVKRRDDVEALS
jgi:hypothetical protein